MYRLKILEDGNPATLELKVDEFFRDNNITRQDSMTYFQRTPRLYIAFIEYEHKNKEALSLTSMTSQPPQFPEGTNLKTVQEFAKEQIVNPYLRGLYEKHGGNITKVAREAGVSRFHMRSLLGQYKIHKIEKEE